MSLRVIARVALWLTGVVILARPVLAKDVVTFRERDLDHHVRAVADGGVVDINSTLDISVDVDEIYRQAGTPSDSLAILTQLLEPLMKLQEGVNAGAANLQPLRDAMSAWAAGAHDSFQVARVRQALMKVANPAARVLEAMEGTSFAARLDEALDQAGRISIEGQYALVFTSLDAEVQALRARRDQLAGEGGVSVQAGAWLRGEAADLPVHLEGLDRYPEREEVIVPRWRIALNDQERAQLRASAQVARALNEGELGNELVAGFAVAARQLAELAEPCAASLQLALTGFSDQLGQSAEPVRNASVSALEKVRRLRTLSLELKTKYAGGDAKSSSSPEAFLQGTNDDLVALTAATQDVRAAIQLLKQVAQAAATDATLRAVLKPILEWQPDACEASLAIVRQAGREIAVQCVGALGLRRRNTSLLAFGEEVLALDLARVPREATLRIPRMGPRKDGDVVEVRLATVRPGAIPRDLQRTRITLRSVLPHIEIAVGLVFARADTGGSARHVFQTAPAYSVLIKGWPVRSYRSNDLLNFGFGLNLAALDFNHDDSQELGIGFVLSGFLENLVQAGYGYNVKAGAPYAFFGLRLPLPDLGLTRTSGEDGGHN